MKKLSVSLLTATALAFGAISFAVPAQAAPATIAPEGTSGYSYQAFWFDSYPPSYYHDDLTGFSGVLKSMLSYPDGRYYATYWGTYDY
ncbi:hypothetical protein OS242_08325 [Tumebacillus sp. DT12]|uniref:Uncharacterized protein n=1 Tax=Tumebacillus lacus TaxID=2995335 RepID=A0ABT3WZ79_9BACL|nr:hypothetical protein [Tumebacillus lacus]MCX7569969.1 hypothetical protein [Tumebacillus lacus]